MATHIKELLKEFAERTPKIARVFDEADAAALWKKLVEEEGLGRAEPINVKNGTLYVEADSSSLAQELSLKKRSLLEKINRLIGGGEVLKDIRFKTGRSREE